MNRLKQKYFELAAFQYHYLLKHKKWLSNDLSIFLFHTFTWELYGDIS